MHVQCLRSSGKKIKSQYLKVAIVQSALPVTLAQLLLIQWWWLCHLREATGLPLKVKCVIYNESRCSGVDYTVESSLSFPIPIMASGGRYCVDLSTVDDVMAEGAEQFQLTFDSITPAGSATEGNPAVLCVLIEDDGMKYSTVKQLIA